MLRSSQIGGHRFRRQVPLGQYIVDFACHEPRLIVEIDGGQHDRSSMGKWNGTASRRSGLPDFATLNNDVLANPEGVWMMLSAKLRKITPSQPPPSWEGPSQQRLPAERLRLEWHRFEDLSAALIYEMLRFRQGIFVVEQASPYPDLDGQDERAHHCCCGLTANLPAMPG